MTRNHEVQFDILIITGNYQIQIKPNGGVVLVLSAGVVAGNFQVLFTFIQLLNSIEDQTKRTVRTLSEELVLVKNIINLLPDCFILDAKQVHLSSTKVIHFADLLI